MGLTFLEINDRAYVRTVDEGSAAALAGIQPQDCIQFACVVGGPQFEHVKPRNIAVIGENSTSPRGSSRRNRLEEQENENERQKLDAKATTFAVECEKSGIRTSYEELRELFAGCTVPPKGGSSNVNESAAHHDPMTTPNRKIQVLASTPGSSKRITITTDDDFTIGDSNSLLLADSVGGMFETGRTKKHNGNISSRCVPSLPDNKTAKTVTRSVTNVARNATVRCFAGGDDNDTQGVDFSEDRFRSRTSGDSKGLLMDLPSTPIKSGGIITTSSPRSQGRSGGGDGISYEDSVMEQQLYPVAMVFRRTVQRKRILSPGKGWGSPGLSLRGSLFGIPSFRMDDECDRAAALIRQLASSRKDHSGSLDQGAFIGDDSDSLQASSVATNPDRPGSNDDIEASTIRGMIQNAVGLGFVRTSKVVVGVSLQAGSGIVVARLPDGTWSAPSAVGVCGLGVGLQFGLEVADYMFILQTKEGVEHFQRGGNFAVGGNIGAAVASVGREAYGAASLGGCSSLNLDDQIQQGDTDDEDDDGAESTYYDGSTRRSNASSSVRSRKQNKKKDSDVAPMVAYAKSQGLYFGVSVDGLKFFTRNDINARAYKFSMLSEMAATDILSGLVAPPPEAEDLYAALHRCVRRFHITPLLVSKESFSAFSNTHLYFFLSLFYFSSVEYVHEINELPRPPEMLRKDSMNDWRYDRSIAAVKGEILDSSSRNVGSRPLYSFLSSLNREEANECALFETKFKKFLYGGVAVQRLMPNAAPTTPGGMTRREKRTLWLMLPEVGSLRLGLVSKFKDDNGDDATMDDVTLVSSIASSRFDADVSFDGVADMIYRVAFVLYPHYCSLFAYAKDQNDLNENGNVKLSKKYSVSLTDITVLSQDPSVSCAS